MKNKDEVLVKLCKYKTKMEALSGKMLTRIMSDFEAEYVNESLYQYLDQHGIIHEKTVPYCKQQNGREKDRTEPYAR
jgi:hypothetical protein